jgi:hypothetical protein
MDVASLLTLIVDRSSSLYLVDFCLVEIKFMATESMPCYAVGFMISWGVGPSNTTWHFSYEKCQMCGLLEFKCSMLVLCFLTTSL